MWAQWIYNRLIPAILAAIALAGLWFWAQGMEWPLYDLMMRWTARPVQNSPVVLVLVDDESIERLKPRFGNVPWPRKTYLDIFQAIQSHDPALMVFDGHFLNINDPDDSLFFQELKSFDNLITGIAMHEAGYEDNNPLNTDIPHYYRLNLGVVSIRQDVDGNIRKITPVYKVRASRYQAGVYPALSLAAASDYLNQQHPNEAWITDIEERTLEKPYLKIHPEARPDDGIMLPMSKNRELYLRWHRLLPQKSAEYQRSHVAVPLWQLMETQPPHPLLKGKIALIGSSSTIYRDYHPSPLSQRHLGPDIHATAIDNLVQSQAIRQAEPWQNWAILLILSSMVFWMRLRSANLGQVLFYALGTIIIFFSFALWLFQNQGIWIQVATPVLFMALSFMAGSTYRILFGEQQLARMEKNLSQLVSPSIFSEIRKSGQLVAGGQKLEITSLFVDIRNFTSWAEHLQPLEVTRLLNEFYTVVVNVVFAHRGTIDKFMGDGILVIFGAPISDSRHADTSLEAACDILDVLERLEGRWRQVYQLEADFGISLNSGPAFVGFLGPETKLEYTAVGDTVNLCVRLQEQTKQFKTRLIVSEFTVKALSETNSNLLELGEVRVKGREAHLKIYTLENARIKD